MIKQGLKSISDSIDKKFFGGHIKSNDIIETHLPDQIADCLHYRSFDESKEIFYNEESVGVVFEIVPLLGVDEKIYNMVNSLLSRSVPSELNLQIMTYSSPKVGTVLDAFSYKNRAPRDIYRTVAKHRVRHFNKGVWNSISKNTPFYLRYHRVIISASIITADNSEAERDILEFSETLENTIQQISPDYLRLKPRDLIRLTHDILNPTQNIRPSADGYDSLEDINFQIVSPETRYAVKVKGVDIQTVGRPLEMTAKPSDQDFKEQSFTARTLECRNFPLYMSFGDMNRAIGDMFSANTRHMAPTLMSLNIHYPTEGDAATSAKMKHIRAMNNAKSPIATYMPEMTEKAKDWQYASEALARAGVWSMSGSKQPLLRSQMKLIRRREAPRIY